MAEDATLLRAIRKLDQEALITVFDTYAPILYKYALRLCGNSSEADDIVGEVFSELLKHLKNGQGPRTNLRSYLYQVAYHKVVDHCRDSDHLTTLDNIESIKNGDSLQTQQEDHDQVSLLESIIKDHLSEDQRHVIVLRFIEEFSLKETADIIGKNVNNIKVIQNRAIAKIRSVLEPSERESL